MPQVPTRKAYKIRSPQTWDLIRSRYTRGETAKSLAEAFDVTEDAIRNRARKEGWTKRAYAAASEQNLSADLAAAAPLKAARPCAPAPDEARAVLDEVADGEQVAALALGAAARCIAAGRFAEAERLGKLAETLSRLAHGPQTVSGMGGSGAGGARRGGLYTDAFEEPEFPPKPEAFMSPGETKRSPYQVEMLRVEVERRFERLAARFERPPSIIGSDADLDPYALDPDDLNEGDAP